MTSQRISRLTPLAEVLARVALVQPVKPREMALADAEGWVLAADVIAAASPAMPVALIDGWAVRAEAVADAGPYVPVRLDAAFVDAGSVMPSGTDAVLPSDAVVNGEIHSSVTLGEGVLAAGADAAAGQVMRRAGEKLRAADVAALQAIGVSRVSVRAPRVRVVALPGCDAAALAISRGIAAQGANVIFVRALERALADEQTDAVIAIGGTGAGSRDESVATLARMGEVAIHGFGIAPGETAALGSAKSHPVLMLPGRLDGALAAFLLVGEPLLRALTGAPLSPGMPVTLARKIASTVGLAEVIPIRRTADGVEPLASGRWPMHALTRADGWVLVPAESEGFAPGTQLEMRAFP